jgi:hypothetical protein
MATPSSMILSGLQMIGDKGIGDTLTTAEQTEYLSRLNMMMDLWANDGLMVYAMQSDSKALTAGVGAYTIGSGGSINTNWPTKISSAYTVDASNVSREIPSIVDDDEWGRIMLKQLGNIYPTVLWYDNAYPLGTINLWPLPLAGLTLYLSSYQRLQSFALISTTLSMPPGYELAITSNFAILAAAGQVPISKELAMIAKDSKAAIKRNNVRVPMLEMPEELAGGGSDYQRYLPRW